MNRPPPPPSVFTFVDKFSQYFLYLFYYLENFLLNRDVFTYRESASKFDLGMALECCSSEVFFMCQWLL